MSYAVYNSIRKDNNIIIFITIMKLSIYLNYRTALIATKVAAYYNVNYFIHTIETDSSSDTIIA